jgi:hypothetical protein
MNSFACRQITFIKELRQISFTGLVIHFAMSALTSRSLLDIMLLVDTKYGNMEESICQI